MSITIHPELEAKLRARADAEGLTVEAYVERISCDDERAEQELEALALEGSTLANRLWRTKRIGTRSAAGSLNAIGRPAFGERPVHGKNHS
jgi:hypothetical protein